MQRKIAWRLRRCQALWLQKAATPTISCLKPRTNREKVAPPPIASAFPGSGSTRPAGYSAYARAAWQGGRQPRVRIVMAGNKGGPSSGKPTGRSFSARLPGSLAVARGARAQDAAGALGLWGFFVGWCGWEDSNPRPKV